MNEKCEAFERKKLTWVAATSRASTSADLIPEARESESAWLYFVLQFRGSGFQREKACIRQGGGLLLAAAGPGLGSPWQSLANRLPSMSASVSI